MSRLQQALHMPPAGSYLIPTFMQSTKALNARLDAYADVEKLLARRIRANTGCTWSQAITQVVRDPELQAQVAEIGRLQGKFGCPWPEAIALLAQALVSPS